MEILFRSTDPKSKDKLYDTENIEIVYSEECNKLLHELIAPDNIFPVAILKELGGTTYFLVLIKIGINTSVFAVTKNEDPDNKFLTYLHTRIGCFTVTNDNGFKVLNHLSEPNKHGKDGTILVHDINEEASVFEILLLENTATTFGLWMLDKEKDAFEAMNYMIANQFDIDLGE